MANESKFRTMKNSNKEEGLLVPYLNQEITRLGDNVWPEEYAIKLYNKERVWDGYFHPSVHAAAAELALYYEFHPDWNIRAPQSNVDKIMTFQVGSAYHSLLQSMFIHMGLTTEEEVEVGFTNEERWVSGHIDIRKIWLPNGEVLPVEIKSTGYLPKEPSENYIKQFQIYMDVGCEEPQEKGIMLYLAKTYPHKFREFIVYRDEKILNEVYNKFDRVWEAIGTDNPDMLEFPCHEIDSREHQWCIANRVCKLGPPSISS